MKKSLALTALALIALTGCSSNEPAPEKTVTVTATPEPDSTTATSSAPTQTTEPTQEPTETPVAAVPETNKTVFTGTTLKGNDILFYILPATNQEKINESVKGTGLTGSWGALCSEGALKEQLMETGVITTEDNGNGHPHVWRSLNYATPESGNFSEDVSAEIGQYLNEAAFSQSGDMKCVAMQTELRSAGQQGYPTATIGHYLGNGTLENTIEAQ